jgi:hypothetical protein
LPLLLSFNLTLLDFAVEGFPGMSSCAWAGAMVTIVFVSISIIFFHD